MAYECFPMPKNAAKKPTKKPAKRTPKVEANPYNEILAMLDQLLDSAEDDISRAALDPLAALRAKCATLTVALRMCLLALSCHGQTKAFAGQIAKNLDTIVQLRKVWDDSENQERAGQEIESINEKEIGYRQTIAEENDNRKVVTDEKSARRFRLVEEEVEEIDEYKGPQEVESDDYASYDEDDEKESDTI